MSRKRKKTSNLYAVIMAGGSGRRFWPRSRSRRPKQMLAIGTDKPLIRETVDRLQPILVKDNLFISCGRDIAARLRKTLPDIPKHNFIIEPTGRDTAPCVGLALQHIKKIAHPDHVIAVLPADHYIGKPGAFRRTLGRAAKTARNSGLIMTIGIVPDRPSPDYGYIRPGPEVKGETGVSRVRSFVEKPDPKTAERYMARGYFWNAGMFIFRLDVMLEAYEKYLPRMARELSKIGASAGTRDHGRMISRIFPKLEKVSIDYGIMEKAGNVAVISGDFDWRDVGGWEALYGLLGGDGVKNVCSGPVEFINSRGCYVEGRKTVALVGVEDLVVIEEDDAILVLGRGRDSKLKELTDQLAKKGKKDLL